MIWSSMRGGWPANHCSTEEFDLPSVFWLLFWAMQKSNNEISAVTQYKAIGKR